MVAVAEGVLQPTFGLYAPGGARGAAGGAEPDAPLTRTVETLDPVHVALPGALVRSVNTPEDLAEAEELLGEPDGPQARRIATSAIANTIWRDAQRPRRGSPPRAGPPRRS